MKNKKILLLATLVAIGVWCYNAYLLRSHFNSNSDLKRDISSGKKSIFQLPESYNAQVRDPFASTPEKVVVVKKSDKKEPVKVEVPIEKPSLTVNGIMWDEKQPTAILHDNKNGEDYIVTVGKEWGDFKILEINKSSVKLLFKNKEFEIR